MPIKRLAISCLFAFAVFLSSFGGTLRAAGPGFAAMAGEPGAVEAGFRLPPRSALVPYPSREEALAGGTSSYVIPLEEWQRDSVPEGVRYTARFKVRYAWDNRAVLLRVEDVPSSFGIEVNGEAAGYSQAGMGRTEFDITDFIRQDYNTVSVIVCEAPAARRIGEGRGRRCGRLEGEGLGVVSALGTDTRPVCRDFGGRRLRLCGARYRHAEYPVESQGVYRLL
mgnify:CR=1 FL=1